MSGNYNQSIIYTIPENCVGCNKCNSGCPAIYANIAYKEDAADKIAIDMEKCIHCGHCIEQCDHNARDYNDNTIEFFNDLKAGENLTVVAAPSIKFNFDNYKKIFGYLKSLGVNIIYDVSFGADITVWAYLNALKQNESASMIAQPCPSVVNYVEKYHPELIKNLAPVQSPVLCTAIYLKKYLGVKDKIAFLSPCISKIDEINDKNTFGYVNYNVTYKKLKAYLLSNNINLDDYEEVDFNDNKICYGSIFPKPGGLKENIKYHLPDTWVKRVEGPEVIYKYLQNYSARLKEGKKVPLIIDVLNCSEGCNMGSATCKDVYIDDIEYEMDSIMSSEELETELKNGYPLFKEFDKNLKPEDFSRNYTDKSALTSLREPTEEEYEEMFVSMHKLTEESQNINCYACGYGNCKDLAKAIFNGANHQGNCVYYNKKELEKEHNLLVDQHEEIQTMFEEVELLNKEIQENERNTFNVLSQMADGLLSIDQNGKIKISNNSIQNNLGYSHKELEGKEISEILIDFDISSIINYVDNRKEMQARKKDGELFTAEVACTRVELTKETAFVFIINDITERKEVERIKNEFISVVSHELRTPITSIRGSLGLLSTDMILKDETKLKKFLNIALNNSDRLINLVNDILDIQKIEAGKMTVKMEELEIIEVVKETVENNKYYAKMYNVDYIVETELKDEKIIADKQRLSQVLTNLLSNATKYSPINDVIKVIVEQINDSIRVSVIDNGPGIPENFKAKLFQKFAQADSSDSRQKNGTGLGLNICKQLMELMNGSISFEKDRNNGTCFFFEIKKV